jgi:hypothetical protein
MISRTTGMGFMVIPAPTPRCMPSPIRAAAWAAVMSLSFMELAFLSELLFGQKTKDKYSLCQHKSPDTVIPDTVGRALSVEYLWFIRFMWNS